MTTGDKQGEDYADEGARYAAIVENSFDAIVSKDLNGIVRSWNKAAEQIFGWKTQEIVGQSIRLIIPADRQHEEDQILARVRAGDTVPKFETIRQHKDGRPVHVAVTVSPLRDRAGTIVGASKIAHDISETLDVRTRLEESERMFRSLANNIPQLAWITDADGYIFWYNDRWYEYTGTTLDEMKGWGWTKVHHPDHLERVKARFQKSLDAGQEWEDTFPLRGANGEYRWFLSRAKPVLDADGRLWGWFGTNTDITAERENEQQISLLMGEVNHRAKNMIAVVQALVSRTVGQQYSESLSQRLQALGRNQDLLLRRNWGGAPLGELISSQLATVADLVGSRVLLEGDLDILLSPSAAETLGLAIHELATNASKYGALSNADGTVRIVCTVDRGAGTLGVRWQEQGGPAVTAPAKSGFGTVMIDRNPKLSLGARVELGYPSSGFFWRMTAPLDRVQLAADPA